MDFAALIQKMAVLFFAILVGFVAGKAKVLDEVSNQKISSLVLFVTNPIQILGSVFTCDHQISNLTVLELGAITLVAYAVLIASSPLAARLLHVPQKDAGLYRFMYIFSNVGFIGYPLVTSLFGENTRFYVTIVVLMYQLVAWSYGVSLIGGEAKFHFTPAILKRPSILAALLSCVIYLTGLRFPAVVGSATSFIGDITSPLAMLIIGCALAQMDLKSIFGCWRIYVLSALKLLAVPAVMYYLLRPIVHDEVILGVSIVSLCMPVASNTTTFSYLQHADTRLASAGVFVTTLLSVITLPLMMYLLFGL